MYGVVQFFCNMCTVHLPTYFLLASVWAGYNLGMLDSAGPNTKKYPLKILTTTIHSPLTCFLSLYWGTLHWLSRRYADNGSQWQCMYSATKSLAVQCDSIDYRWIVVLYCVIRNNSVSMPSYYNILNKIQYFSLLQLTVLCTNIP